VVRERLREDKEAVGCKLFEVPSNSFRLVGNQSLRVALGNMASLQWQASVEQRIEELTVELAFQGVCLRSFWATEAAFMGVIFTFNLLSLYQQATRLGQTYKQPAALRSSVILVGALLG
jgi:hypothetical protein